MQQGRPRGSVARTDGPRDNVGNVGHAGAPGGAGVRAERPRERMIAAGPGALTDAELLAVLLGTGCPGQDSVELGRALLARFGSLRGMLQAPPAELRGARGLGAAKAARICAVVEISRRTLAEELRAPEAQFGSPGAVRDYLRLALSGKDHEVFVVLLLDSQNRLIQAEELFRGTLTQTSVYPREVVKVALRANAAGAIFAHNHPSGVAEPSRADELLTHTLRSALSLVDVRTLDHFVVAGAAVVSMAERGLL
jgi:DNA repair protein RadC